MPRTRRAKLPLVPMTPMDAISEEEEIDLKRRAASVVFSITGSVLMAVGFAFVGRSAFV